MKYLLKLSCVTLFFVSFLQAQNNTSNSYDALMTSTIYSGPEVTNIMFFTNGSYNIQEISDGSEVSSTSLNLTPADLKTLQKLVKSVRPMVLKNVYSCNDQSVDRENSIIYNFSKSKKTVIIDNACKTTKKLDQLKAFVQTQVNKK